MCCVFIFPVLDLIVVLHVVLFPVRNLIGNTYRYPNHDRRSPRFRFSIFPRPPSTQSFPLYHNNHLFSSYHNNHLGIISQPPPLLIISQQPPELLGKKQNKLYTRMSNLKRLSIRVTNENHPKLSNTRRYSCLIHIPSPILIKLLYHMIFQIHCFNMLKHIFANIFKAS